MDSLDHRATWKRVAPILCGDRNSYRSTWEFEFAGIYQRLLTSKKCRDIRPFKPRCELVREDLAVSSAQQYDYAFACSGAKCASKGKPVLIAIHQVDGSAKQEWQFTENRVLINLVIIIFHRFGHAWACFSKVPKLFGRISGDIILFLSSKRRRLEARNFAVIIIIFIPFTTY